MIDTIPCGAMPQLMPISAVSYNTCAPLVNKKNHEHMQGSFHLLHRKRSGNIFELRNMTIVEG